MSKSFTGIVCGVLAAISVSLAPVMAKTCGGSYVVQDRDTLTSISTSYFGTARKWRSIYNANYKLLGTKPGLIFPGQKLVIPCGNVAAVKKPARRPPAKAPEETPAAAVEAKSPAPGDNRPVTLLTAGDYKPFTDQKLPHGGMLTEIVGRALKLQHEQTGGPAAKIVWVNDWAAHLDPLLVNKAFDMGFPWFKPDCSRYDELDDPAKFRCDRFYFSKPLFEILVLFFKRKGSDFSFASDDAVIGKRLCRPSGYFTFDLDKDGRNWVKDAKVRLLQPQSVEDCFRLLQKGKVDAVALNEFTGRAAVRKLHMASQVEAIERPVSILTLHVIIAKTHERAQRLLKYVNDGLERIRSNGIYGEIVDRHLTRFWGAQGQS